jgi:hypothetical protein
VLGIIAFWKKRIVKFLVAISLLSILFILGDNFIFYKLFYNFVPGFDKFRGIGRFGLIFAFSFSLLGGYGFDYFVSNADSEKVKKFIKYFVILVSGFIVLWLLFQVGLLKGLTEAYKDISVYNNSASQLLKTVIILLALLGLLILFQRKIISQQMGLVLFILLAFADLYTFGSQHNTSSESLSKFYQNPGAIDLIKKDYNHELYRIKGRTSENLFVFDQNQGMIDFMFMIDGYNPLNLKDRFPPHRVNDLMNVKYFAAVNKETGKLMFEVNENYVPRVWISYHPVVEPSLEGVSKLLEDSTFDVRTKVIIDKDPGIPIDTIEGSGSLILSSYSINEIAFEMETDKNGILVLSEVPYPNWKVFVDGVEKPMLKCYGALRGVAVETGTHAIVFKYIDKEFQQGATITFFALTIIAGGFLMEWYKRKKLPK